MAPTPFGAAARKGPEAVSDQPKPETPQDSAWMVLDAANDLGDQATVEICRRVIDANLTGKPVSPSDLHVIVDYFR